MNEEPTVKLHKNESKVVVCPFCSKHHDFSRCAPVNFVFCECGQNVLFYVPDYGHPQVEVLD